MTLIQERSAANAAVQTDLLVNSVHRLSGQNRMITGGALCSPTAAANPGTGIVNIFVADVLVATLVNNKDGAPLAYEMFPIGAYVPAGSELRAIVTEAAGGSNVLLLALEIDEVGSDAASQVMNYI